MTSSNIPPSRTKRQVYWAAAIFVSALLMVVFGAFYFGGKKYFLDSVLPSLLGPTAIAFSAIWASWFAYQAIMNQRRVGDSTRKTSQTNAKLRATLDFILRTELDREFIDAKLKWAKCEKGCPDGIEGLLARAHYGTAEEDELTDSVGIRTFFNNFELVALAISQGIIDGEFYARWHQSAFISVWNHSAKPVGVLRALMANDKIYVEWETLARQWGDDTARQVAHPPEYSTARIVELAGLKEATAPPNTINQAQNNTEPTNTSKTKSKNNPTANKAKPAKRTVAKRAPVKPAAKQKGDAAE